MSPGPDTIEKAMQYGTYDIDTMYQSSPTMFANFIENLQDSETIFFMNK